MTPDRLCRSKSEEINKWPTDSVEQIQLIADGTIEQTRAKERYGLLCHPSQVSSSQLRHLGPLGVVSCPGIKTSKGLEAEMDSCGCR